MACFLPFCRTHCADNAKPRTPWSYDEPTLNTIREFLQLRYRLMPYFYTLARKLYFSLYNYSITPAWSRDKASMDRRQRSEL